MDEARRGGLELVVWRGKLVIRGWWWQSDLIGRVMAEHDAVLLALQHELSDSPRSTFSEHELRRLELVRRRFARLPADDRTSS
jgi:hypothetical protein